MLESMESMESIEPIGPSAHSTRARGGCEGGGPPEQQILIRCAAEGLSA